MRYHHIRELITDKKLEVWKVDTNVNIVDSLMKPLPNHRFRVLRRQMELHQAKEHKGVESNVAARESEIERAEMAKSKESNKRKVEKAIRFENA